MSLKYKNYMLLKTKMIRTGLLILIFSLAGSVYAQKFELFKDALPSGVSVNDDKIIREGGPSGSIKYIYVGPSDITPEIKDVSIRIRKNPGPGEYRYITFTWIKWGGTEIGLGLGTKNNSSEEGKLKYKFGYWAGKNDSIRNVYTTNAINISKNTPGNWTAVTRDLYKDFGEFTLTNVAFICPERRDAGFDDLVLGRSMKDLAGAPPIAATKVVDKVNFNPQDDVIDGATLMGGEAADSILEENAAMNQPESDPSMEIDWAGQIKAGGVWMYPLYALGFLAIVIALQRFIISRPGRLAPKKLTVAVKDDLTQGDVASALEASEQSQSTLAKSLRFILKHRNEGREVVSQTAGDIAARDIRDHLDRIYPLSVIASLSPLLGLLGTIVGMIEAFGLVTLYGDEGGPAILSDAISKALITTAAGLIIATPCIAIYFVLKRRIKRLASRLEESIEETITQLYFTNDTSGLVTDEIKEESHADRI